MFLFPKPKRSTYDDIRRTEEECCFHSSVLLSVSSAAGDQGKGRPTDRPTDKSNNNKHIAEEQHNDDLTAAGHSVCTCMDLDGPGGRTATETDEARV
jgi:hypothetical protein